MARVNVGLTGRALSLLTVGCVLAVALVGCLRGGSKTANNASPATAAPVADANAPIKPELRYKVVTDQADFFHISPQQPGGADEHLKKDVRVTLVKRYGGYTEIKTANSISGYVPSEDVARLSAQEVVQEDAALLAKQQAAMPGGVFAPVPGGSGGSGGSGVPYSTISNQTTREAVLPVPDATPTPNPMFRY